MDFTGITYNGRHSSDFNILRVSDGDRYQDTLVPDFEDYTESVSGGIGSYYYGSEDKQKEFSLNFAFDSMNETDMRQVKQWLGAKKPCDLIFDEWPYKAYSAKISSPPSVEVICFMKNGERVYKGEIFVNMVCYYPYARSVSKDKVNFTELGSKFYKENNSEWMRAAGLKELSYEGYDKYNDSKIKLYNPGDLETDYILSHQVGLFEIPSAMGTLNSAGFLEEDKTFTLVHSLDGNSFSIKGDNTLTPSGTYYKNEFLRKINLIDPTNLDRAYYRLNSQTYDIEPLQNDNREIDNIPVNTSFQTTGGDFYLVFRVKGNGTAVQPIANCLLEITSIDILGADPFKVEIKEGVTSTDSFYIGKTTLDAGRYSIKVLVNFVHFSNLTDCSFSIYLFEAPTGSTSVTGTIKIDSYRKEVYWETNGRKMSLNCLLSKGDFGKIPLSIPGQELSMQIKGINDCIKDTTIEYDYLYY